MPPPNPRSPHSLRGPPPVKACVAPRSRRTLSKSHENTQTIATKSPLRNSSHKNKKNTTTYLSGNQSSSELSSKQKPKKPKMKCINQLSIISSQEHVSPPSGIPLINPVPALTNIFLLLSQVLFCVKKKKKLIVLFFHCFTNVFVFFHNGHEHRTRGNGQLFESDFFSLSLSAPKTSRAWVTQWDWGLRGQENFRGVARAWVPAPGRLVCAFIGVKP